MQYQEMPCGPPLTFVQSAGQIPVQFAETGHSSGQTVGKTPHQYLLECRVNRACDMLIEGKSDLADIVYGCGFSSQSHMNNVFHNRLGVTPGHYQAQVRC